MDKPEALRLADALDECKYVDVYRCKQAAAELRRLHEENTTLKQSVARLQQYHATAWNRGHTMGMKANEDTARRALDAVKQDAWGNTQLTEALLKAEAQRDALLEALKKIAAIENRMFGSDWEEIDEAREIARAAIAAAEGEGK